MSSRIRFGCLVWLLACSLFIAIDSIAKDDAAKEGKKSAKKDESVSSKVAKALLPSSVIPVPRDKEEDWMPRHDKLVQKAKESTAELVFFGDSITEGMDPVQLKKIFGPSVENFGIGGDRTQHLIWRFQHGELDFKKDPKLMVMLIGTNNLRTWPGWPASTIPEILTGVKADIAEAQKQLPDTKFLILGLLPRDQKANGVLRGGTKKVNELLKSLPDNKRVFYIDIGDKLLEKDGTIADKIMPDYLHPSPDGYEVMFKAIKPTTDELLKK
jgi:lysophospholipase L1-like esterase